MSTVAWGLEEARLFDADGDTFVQNLYKPANFALSDPWGEGARRGWAKITDISGKRVAYLGIGAGAEAAQALLNSQVPETMILNDIVPSNLDICQANLEMAAGMVGLARLNAVRREGRAEKVLDDLARQGQDLDLIIGCLPQVPDTGNPDTDQIAHVYPVSAYPKMSQWGLGLLYAVLLSARGCLKPDGRVSFVVSGRIPWPRVETLFTDTGFRKPEVAFRFMVRHHLGTPLNYLIGKRGVSLFGDAQGEIRLEPVEAERRRQRILADGGNPSNLRVFHWVHLVEASPLC